ncbi:hypothetical protein M1N44_03895, partial [Dehalococcoidia bacterium]|nr:hypothetical protein [Dehalococcoidia bacterium]MCL0092449.1 hypothetical protein [Dehalococcoidia bacterium]
MAEPLPALSGNQLDRLLEKDGFVPKRRATHGIAKVKRLGNRNVVTIISDTTEPLPDGTLSAILGPKQTGIGKKGLRELIKKYG